MYIDACKQFNGSDEFCRFWLKRGPFPQRSRFAPLNELLKQFRDGVPARCPLPELAGLRRKNTRPFADCMGSRGCTGGRLYERRRSNRDGASAGVKRPH